MSRENAAGALRFSTWGAHVLFAFGIFGPCMTVTPRLGEHTALGEWLGLLDEPETYSIFTGVRTLLEDGNRALGVLLLFFSILFPLAKLIALRVCLSEVDRGRPTSRTHRFAAALGKFSMVDVFVIALLVVASKTLPGGTTIDVRWAAFAFAASALLAIPVGLLVGRMTTVRT